MTYKEIANLKKGDIIKINVDRFCLDDCYVVLDNDTKEEKIMFGIADKHVVFKIGYSDYRTLNDNHFIYKKALPNHLSGEFNELVTNLHTMYLSLGEVKIASEA